MKSREERIKKRKKNLSFERAELRDEVYVAKWLYNLTKIKIKFFKVSTISFSFEFVEFSSLPKYKNEWEQNQTKNEIFQHSTSE